MTIEETKKVMAYIAAAYPRYFANITRGSAERQAIPWYDALKEYSAGAVITGVKSYIAADRSGFPPAPGQIIAYIHASAPDISLSAQEAWAMVRKAVNVPWERMQESFDALPETVRKAVGSAASLKELAQMDVGTFESVAASNFMRTFNAVQNRDETHDRMPVLPEAVRERIAAELEARRLARKMTDSRDVRELNGRGMTILEQTLESPAEKADDMAADPEGREHGLVSGDSVTAGMQRLRAKLGA